MNEIKNRPPPKGICFSIKLGNPKYECARFGICEIDLDGDFHLPNFEKMDKRARVIASIAKNKQFVCHFDRSSLTPQTDEEHFSSGFFIMEVAKELPIKLSDKLGIAPCQIEAGVYAVTVRKQHYKILMVIKPVTGGESLGYDCSKRAVALSIF